MESFEKEKSNSMQGFRLAVLIVMLFMKSVILTPKNKIIGEHLHLLLREVTTNLTYFISFLFHNFPIKILDILLLFIKFVLKETKPKIGPSGAVQT